MSTVTPTTAELTTNIVGQLEASLSQTIPLFPKAFIRVLAKVLAAVVVLVYRYASFSLLQQFIAHATYEATEVNGVTIRPLVEWGRQIGVGDPIAAVRAELVTRVTVLTQVGTLKAGTLLLRASTGVVYQTTADRLLDAATVDVTVRASSDEDGGDGAGDIGNLAATDIITFANPPAAVSGDAVVQSTAVVGADAEAVEVYRTRALEHEQAKPQGGAYADYRDWGRVVSGVAAIYPYTGVPGTVDVYVEATAAYEADGIPDSALLAAVFNAIELDVDGLANNRPANAKVDAKAISRTAFDVVVSGLSATDPATVQAEVGAGVDEFLRSRAPFIVGISVLPRADRITQAAIAGVVNDIVSAAGGTVASVAVKEGALTIAARTLRKGETAKLGTATYP